MFGILARDHPRVCGEQIQFRESNEVYLGSSPRVRGTDTNSFDGIAKAGIIPACAGNRPADVCPHQKRWDHPRVCGEQSITVALAESPRGSSPRVRGTGIRAHKEPRERGIIPACAGNSRAPHESVCSMWDHPRVCGEQKLCYTVICCFKGSSPRVRGTVLLDALILGRGGIIPACAGNSTYKVAKNSRDWDHPRVCGEQSVGRSKKPSRVGSSPRVRGTGQKPGQ